MKAIRDGTPLIALVQLLGMAVLIAGGCASRTTSPQNTYVLETQIPASRAGHRNDALLVVAEPRAQPGFDTRRIAYSRTPLSLEYYLNSEWADTPARMLAPLLVRALENAAGFRGVVAAPAPIDGDLRLDVDVVRFQQEFLGAPSRMRIALRATLIDMSTRQVLASRVFEDQEPAPSEDAYGGVRAANIALGRLLGKIVDFVLAHV
jgi:cholesterol transport system auxiliary component